MTGGYERKIEMAWLLLPLSFKYPALILIFLFQSFSPFECLSEVYPSLRTNDFIHSGSNNELSQSKLMRKDSDLSFNDCMELTSRIENDKAIDSISLVNCVTTNEILAYTFTTSLLSRSITYMNVLNCRMNQNVLQLTIDALKNLSSTLNCQLKLLDLSSNDLDDDSIVLLALIIKVCKNLETLILDSNKLSVNSVEVISSTLRSHVHLSKISFSNCGLVDECIQPLLQNMKNCHCIKYLDLSMNDLTSEGCQSLCNAFRTGFGKNIEVLNLSYNHIGDSGILNLAKAIETNQLPSLKQLILRKVSSSIC